MLVVVINGMVFYNARLLIDITVGVAISGGFSYTGGGGDKWHGIL